MSRIGSRSGRRDPGHGHPVGPERHGQSGQPGQGHEPVPRRQQHGDRALSRWSAGWSVWLSAGARRSRSRFVLAVVAAAILLPLLLRIDLAAGRAARAVAAGDVRRILYGRQRSIAIAVTNYGVVANMIHRHGFRNTILPLYAATALGLGGISIATAIALMSDHRAARRDPGRHARRPTRATAGDQCRAGGGRRRGPRLHPDRRPADASCWPPPSSASATSSPARRRRSCPRSSRPRGARRCCPAIASRPTSAR